MKIVIEGTYTTPNAVFLDDCVRIGHNRYPYEDITDVRSVSAPARLVNGLVQFSTRDGEVLHITYFLRDTEKMRKALQTVMPYVRKNKAEQASSAFLDNDIFKNNRQTYSQKQALQAAGQTSHAADGTEQDPAVHSPSARTGGQSLADELLKLSLLRDKGDLSQEEFELLKKRLIENS